MPSAVQGSSQSFIQNAPEVTTNSKLSKIKPIVGGAVGGGALATAGIMAYMHHAAIAGAFTTAGKAIIGVGATALGTIGGGAGATLIGAFNSFKTLNTRHNSQLTAIQNLNFNDIFEKAEDGRHLKLKEGIDPHQHLYNKYGSMFKSVGGTNYSKLLQSINKNIDKELPKHDSPTDAVSKAIRNTLEGDLTVSQFRKAGTAMAMYIAAGALIGSAVGGSLGAGFGAAPTALIGAACGLGLGIIGAIAAYGVANTEGKNIAAKANDFAGGLELDTVEMGPNVDGQRDQTSNELRPDQIPLPDDGDEDLLTPTPTPEESTEFNDGYHIDLMHESQKPSDAIPQVIEPNAQGLDATPVNDQHLSQKSPLSQFKDSHKPATTFEGKDDEIQDKELTPRLNRSFLSIDPAFKSGLFRSESNASSLIRTPTSATDGDPIFSGQTTLVHRPTNVSGRSIESSRGVMDSISRAGTIASLRPRPSFDSDISSEFYTPYSSHYSTPTTGLTPVDENKTFDFKPEDSVKTPTHRPTTSRRGPVLSTVLETPEDKRSSAGSAATIKEGGSTTSTPKRDFSFGGHSQDNIDHGLFSVPQRMLNNLQRERKAREAREARESSSSTASVEPTRSQTLPLTFGEFIKSEASESGSQKIHALFDKQIKQHTSLEGFVSKLSDDEDHFQRTQDPKEQFLLDAFNNFNLKDPEGSVQARNALNHLLEM
ncbi:MAG: glycine zipper family protein [Pseudomonadota bacterium]|nr:hypothetical protein [Gammaproteobacteria bacterium]MEC8009449.1 glycine zipper family protein [Pseudomonadota bacterium]|tara:strand:+ start:33261 stop:35387 length:2127 start_codon:yes stop_codon:yes gene_type:complete